MTPLLGSLAVFAVVTITVLIVAVVRLMLQNSDLRQVNQTLIDFREVDRLAQSEQVDALVSASTTELLQENEHLANRIDAMRQEHSQRITKAREMLTEILKTALLIAIICGLSMPASGQPIQKQQSVVTNGELTPELQFHLLVIHDGSQNVGPLVQMLKSPRSAEMRGWASGCETRFMHVGEPAVRQHHDDLMQKHAGQLPIIAFVDRAGGVWWSAAGDQVPRNERALASTLSQYYSATLDAASRAQTTPTPLMNAGPPATSQRDMQSMPADGGSYFLQSGIGAPDAVKLPQLPQALPNIRSVLVASEMHSLVLLAGAFAVACVLILAASPVISSSIIAAAITEDNDPN